MRPSNDSAFWESDRDELLINPRLPHAERTIFENAWRRECERVAGEGLPGAGRIAIPTSGSAGKLKLVLIRKEALLVAARAANTHLASSSNDVWLKTLPDFHVGGLSIFARAFLSGAAVVDMRDGLAGGWSAEVFARELEAASATFTSLVPAQVFDLVASSIVAPSRLRAVIVGGGSLSDDLYKRARELGWPLLPSYGLTECGSQVATTPLRSLLEPAGISPELQPLSHVEVRSNQNRRLEILSAALFDGYLWLEGDTSRFEDPKRDGWFETEDLGTVNETGGLRIEGRQGEFLKIGGESVDLVRLDAKLEAAKLSLGILAREAALVPVPDERLGVVIHLVHASNSASIDDLVVQFNTAVAPFERIRAVHKIREIPYSAIGKLMRGSILELIGFSDGSRFKN